MINRMRFLLWVGCVICLTGCIATSDSTSSPPFIQNDVKTTILFSEPDPVDQEKPYLDALLELQSLYPNEVPHVLVTSGEHEDVIRYFQIEQFPTLIVVQGDKVFLRLEGEYSTAQIIKEIERVYHLSSKSLSKKESSFIYTIICQASSNFLRKLF